MRHRVVAHPDNRRVPTYRRSIASLAFAMVTAGTSACSPALDWRTVHPQGSGVEMLFPCRPDHHVRTVRLVGVEAQMAMDACDAAGATFSLAFVDAPDAARRSALLEQLRRTAIANIEGTSTAIALRVPGAASDPQGARLRIDGRLADRRQVVEHVAFFVKGSRVYQASAIGGALSADAVDFFFTSIKVAP